jgi:RNA polymerase primary sigma factor
MAIKRAIIKEPISLETPVTDDLNIGDYIVDKSIYSPEVQTGNSVLKHSIGDLLASLSQKEKTVIANRFGIDGKTPKTLEQIGDLLGYSKERIRQISENALLKIRQKEEVRHFKDFIGD